MHACVRVCVRACVRACACVRMYIHINEVFIGIFLKENFTLFNIIITTVLEKIRSIIEELK